MSRVKAYFGLGWIISLILAIIPFTSLVCGLIVRLQRKKTNIAILEIVLWLVGVGLIFFWIVDLVSIILHKDLVYLA